MKTGLETDVLALYGVLSKVELPAYLHLLILHLESWLVPSDPAMSLRRWCAAGVTCLVFEAMQEVVGPVNHRLAVLLLSNLG